MRVPLEVIWLLVAAYPTANWQDALGVVVTPGGDYIRGYATGAAEAEKDLKGGAAAFCIYGTRESPEFLDRETGLPRQVIAGCVVSNTIIGRAAGYNDRVKKFIKESGLPSNSFKRWEKVLFDLEGHYGKRAENVKPHHLTLGGEATHSTDGKFALSLAKKEVKERDGSRTDYMSFVITRDNGDSKPLGLIYRARRIDAFWGPAGSGFAVVRTESERRTEFRAIDLSRGQFLRVEYVLDTE
jgi:hypothetical protein